MKKDFDFQTLPADLRLRLRTAPQGSDELTVQVMAHLADVYKVREEGGANRGSWVARFLKSVGLGVGYPWCAAAMDWACDVSGVWSGNSGAVRHWVSRAKDAQRLRSTPQRGRACYRLNPGGMTGHIGIVVAVLVDGRIESLEGNTSPGVKGSQRDGDGLYRRVRDASFWHGFIELGDL